MLRILCVCTGNTCRSPMAQALLQHEADRRGLPLAVSSAGLAAFPGDSPSENAVLVMREWELDITAHRARPVTAYALEESDYVLCMSESHRAALLPYVPQEKLVVPPGGVPDPFGGDEAVYRRTRDALHAFLCDWLQDLASPVVAPLEEAGIPAVAALETACFSTPWSEDAVRAELQNENAHLLTLAVCGDIVGYIGVQIILDEAYVTNLAVAPAFRRKGYGRRLLEAAIALCESCGCAFLSLEVRASNEAAKALYASRGFTERGKRKNYYQKPAEDALILTRDFGKNQTEKDDPACES